MKDIALRTLLGSVAMATFLTGASAAAPVPARAASTSAGDYTVATESPSGTTINLFDYWVRGTADTSDYWDPETGTYYNAASLREMLDEGINGGHDLKFSRFDGSVGLKTINRYNRSGLTGAMYGALEDGYPKLKQNASLGISEDASLAYLFDASAQPGKRGYLGVTGLLQSIDGYYEYNSQENFASYNANTNAFDIYNSWAVMNNQHTAPGQFFPFNTADEVFKKNADGSFKVDANGKLVADRNVQSIGNKTLKAAGPLMNHYFGLTMKTRFLQPADGIVQTGSAKGEPMTYGFTGDDDVWVYIDGVLVGDLTGNHDALSLSINFQTGAVAVSRGDGKQQDGLPRETTLKEIFRAVKGDDYVAENFKGKTFKDDTAHTLSFFYLERGNMDSNMKLKFNLVEVPQSDAIKVDQLGSPVPGAGFALYTADENYDKGEKVAEGTTDAKGQIVFVNAQGDIINFDDLYNTKGYERYVLVETTVPEGYRSQVTATSQHPIKLAYQRVNGQGRGFVVNAGGTGSDSPVWRNGAFASAGELITADATIRVQDGGATRELTDDELSQGTLFAVVYKRDVTDPLDEVDSWHPVWGTAEKGYAVGSATGRAGALKAIENGAAKVFSQGQTARYRANIEELPGELSDYYWMRHQLGEDTDPTKYALAVYFTSGSLKDATEDNTALVESDGFDRQFSTRVHVANIKNELYVQKSDGNGAYLSGATFSLYRASEVDATGDAPQLKEGARAYDTVTTQDRLSMANLPGAAVFPSDVSATPLKEGVYYLAETQAPDGYRLRDGLIKVIVDADGVHADAGTADDGVQVAVGVGQLVKSMAQFGTNDALNRTLSYVVGTPMRATLSAGGSGTASWEAVPGADPLALHYDLAKATLEYALDGDGFPAYVADAGWARLKVTQDTQKGVTAARTAGVGYAELPDADLTGLFSGSTIVRVDNEYEPAPVAVALQVQKSYQKRDGSAIALTAGAFTFNLYDGNLTADQLESATPLQTKTNAADGTVAFDALDYAKPGECEYTIAEVKGDRDDVAYDQTVHHAKVSVTDVAGKLKATVTYDGSATVPTFKNTYTPPSEPSTDGEKSTDGSTGNDGGGLPGTGNSGGVLPGTGDDSLARVVGVAAVGIAAVGAGVWCKRRR